jgi:hypothetical protein
MSDCVTVTLLNLSSVRYLVPLIPPFPSPLSEQYCSLLLFSYPGITSSIIPLPRHYCLFSHYSPTRAILSFIFPYPDIIVLHPSLFGQYCPYYYYPYAGTTAPFITLLSGIITLLVIHIRALLLSYYPRALPLFITSCPGLLSSLLFLSSITTFFYPPLSRHYDSLTLVLLSPFY